MKNFWSQTYTLFHLFDKLLFEHLLSKLSFMLHIILNQYNVEPSTNLAIQKVPFLLYQILNFEKQWLSHQFHIQSNSVTVIP